MPDILAYSKTSHDIRITAYSVYLDEQSTPKDNTYIWAYHINIENLSEISVQLKTRHWKITNSYGQTHEVHGDGVVGETPTISHGQGYEYTSGVSLSTPSGIMVGIYKMETECGKIIEVSIPAFSLDSPHETATLN